MSYWDEPEEEYEEDWDEDDLDDIDYDDPATLDEGEDE